MCAGLIGYRALRKAGDPARVGLYGFGAAAHIVAQLARYEGRAVFAFVRAGDEPAMTFARALGAAWAGLPMRCRRSRSMPPSSSRRSAGWCRRPCARVRPGGRVVCAGIHMSPIPSFPTTSSGRSARSSRSPT